MKILVAGAKKASIIIVNERKNQNKIVDYKTEISKCAELLKQRGCQVIEVECGSDLLNAIENHTDLNGVIVDASIQGGQLHSLDAFGKRVKEKKLTTYIIETQPSASDHLFATLDGVELIPLPQNSNLQKNLNLLRESDNWKAWAKDWVFNDAGDAVYLLLQEIYPGFSSKWWFSKKTIKKEEA